MNPANKAFRIEAAEPERHKAALAGVYEAYRRHDAGPLFDLLAEDVSYNSVAGLGDVRFAGPCLGKPAVIANIASIAEDYELEKYDDLEMIAGVDLVAVHADVAFRHRKTGKLAHSEKIDLIRMQGGKILEFNEFFDTLSARAASFPD